MTQKPLTSDKYLDLYKHFDAPIADVDCGKRCAPHNVGGKPFCCDILHAVPTAYENEWAYIKKNTNLWHPWRGDSCGESPEEAQEEFKNLMLETPDNMILLECLGPDACERDYRTLTCRQFPFFPYVDSNGEFIGLAYYWEYDEMCWVISNLEVVTEAYRKEFVQTFKTIFSHMPEELITYQFHSGYARDEYIKMDRKLPLLHRDGNLYLIDPQNEEMEQAEFKQLEKFGPYGVVADMPFPDEIE